MVLQSGVAQTNNASLALMPQPARVTASSGPVRLDGRFRVAVVTPAGAVVASPRLLPAVNRFLKRLAGRTGLFFDVPTVAAVSPAVGDAPLAIYCDRPGALGLGEDESYQLTISGGKCTLRAPTDLGALRGLETLLQLLDADADGYFFPAFTIADAPRFPWRGLLIDVARHFEPVAVIKRNLDGMAMVKLNVLHWHLSDDQGFRVESRAYPKLHQLGSDGLYYTQEEIRDVIRYADQRGIRVVPEFDMPGHATSWLVGYPALASGPPPGGATPGKDSTYVLERKWGIFKPTIDPTRETTYTFLDNFLREMTALFPDPYFHIGGDENEGSQWRQNPKIRAFMQANKLADNHALQGYFNQRVLAILTKQGKKMMGWDEIFTPGVATPGVATPGLPKDVIIHSWRGKQSLIEAARQGYQVVLSNGYYIDLNYSAAKHYLNDPVPANTPLDAAAQKRVLGGEAAMWSEYVDEGIIDARIWPRTAAIAERLWSPREVNQVDDMYRRMSVISWQLEEVGLTHLRNVDVLLRRLARGVDLQPLRTLVEVVEPVKEYARGGMATYTTFSPLTRVVDAANPDSERARLFTKAVEAFLDGKINQQVKATLGKKPGPETPVVGAADAALALETQLKQWQANHERLKPLMADSPVLREILSLSEDLSTVAGIGLEALAYIRSGQPAPAGWLESRRKRLETAKAPRGQVLLVVVEPITRLANWASVKK